VIIDDEAILIQGLGFKHQFYNIIMPMQATTFMCLRETFYDVAGTEMKLFGDSIHGGNPLLAGDYRIVWM